jgi:hypothetical protein
MRLLSVLCIVIAVSVGVWDASASVFLSEVFVNPPGSLDDTREFIELTGTPGMKLDGYAVAVVAGGLQKYYTLGSIGPGTRPVFPEVDEFFSLDGLALGANGILVIGIGAQGMYPTLLADSSFRQWTTIWNGGLDTPGKIQNDGSLTILLIRRRPGITQADPSNPGGLRWGKDIAPDDELITPVDHDVCTGGSNPGTPCYDGSECLGGGTCQPGQVDQYGDGNLDKGQPNNIDGGNTLDIKGASTLADVSDDLEVVDEVSWEHERGWEYDVDGRHVDDGSTRPGLPRRHVHGLDDPQGINPDVLSRVDYRTKGNGWTPATGGVGEMANGNNWQDTATEQWVRGESLVGSGGQGSSPQMFYDNAANPDPNAIQPYNTQVPLWLNDGAGSEYNFSAQNTYQIMAGRVNPLAVAFIPGDVDRDGDCDADDIAKIAAVFGDDDWIFSNSFNLAPEGDSGDPATQTRPWDVDATGDNGIEASDLQWVLSFQGNTDGRIVGRRYDSTTPSATGVKLNSNAGVGCTVYASAVNVCGGSLTSAAVGDMIALTVSAAVTSGANTTAGEQNGIMQFVQDVAVNNAGILQLVEVAPLGQFIATRASLVELQGTAGDLGARRVNGYTTGFTQGLAGAVPLYRVTFQAVGLGNAAISISPSAEAKFAISTPRGLKIGHTNTNGDPASTAFPSAVAVNVTSGSNGKGDINNDSLVNLADVPLFVNVLLGSDTDPARRARSDMNCDGAPDGLDVSLFVEKILP